MGGFCLCIRTLIEAVIELTIGEMDLILKFDAVHERVDDAFFAYFLHDQILVEFLSIASWFGIASA